MLSKRLGRYMRVIRTEYYIDKMNQIKTRRPRHMRMLWGPYAEKFESGGIAFAWFRGDCPVYHPNITFEQAWLDAQLFPVKDINLALDLIVGEERLFPSERLSKLAQENLPLQFPELVEFILEQNVLIEQSPPNEIKFKDLVKGLNTPMMLGAYLGYEMAGDSPGLLFLFVPSGILVVGTVLGITEALATGLNKQIARLFDKGKETGDR